MKILKTIINSGLTVRMLNSTLSVGKKWKNLDFQWFILDLQHVI